ncbi:hypothetical protein UFOVP211_3 [uncultured Caudovirales phage]|uniref:Uncharacterized protein n=1 Tax=uncultured Caudovirales phage TaxID=2100421 RepID=A0A6J7WNC5_9CAUD|nr:hypothetical protein UFOVP211_3 [uncultured Caudovirales phage]
MAETKTINLNVETNIDELSVKINDINQKLYKLYAAEKDDADATLKLIAEKKKLQNQLNDLNKAVTNNTTNLRNQKVGFDGLGNSVNQISRELPAFTNSLNTGFMAISNNLPILFDEINKVKQANVELAASGQPTVSVFKTLTSAIFSWGTALSLGVTLLTVYGGKIIEYFTKDNEQRKKNNELISESSKYIAKESTEYIGLVTSLKNTNQGSKERKDLIEKINSQYSTTLKNIDDERLFQDQLNNSIKDYLIYQRAKFELKKNEEKITSILQRQSEVQNKLAGAEINLQRIQSEGASSGRFAGGYENYNETLKEAQKQVQRYTYSNNELNKQLEQLGFTQLQLITQTEGKYLPVKEKEQKKEEEIKDLRNEIVDEQIKQIDKVNQREQTQLIVNAERRIKEINDSNATESQKSELIKEIRTNLIADLDKLDTEYYKKDVEAKKEADRLKVQAENDYLLKIENLQEESYLLSLSNQDREIQIVNDKYFALEQAAKGNAEQEKIIEEAKQRDISEINRRYLTKRWQMASQALSILSDATTLFTTKNEKDAKAQFKIQKAFNLSSAIINTALAVTGALTAGGNPIKLATGMQFVEAGIAAAAGAVNIAKISAQQFSANGGGGGSDTPQQPASVSQSMTPTFNISGGNQTSQLLQGLQAQPLKAYVVSSDITSAQLLDQKAIKTSVL